MYRHDDRIVVTLDAGGTNFVFGAMKGCEFITEPLRMDSNAHDLDLCLKTMVDGFSRIIDSLEYEPVAISFAFPGPADYAHGIIGGNLPNFPSFRGGVALGPYLSMKFGIPVFINNDGNLFAYGEAMAGALPWINEQLEAAGSSKRYRNLLGVTLGTGFGAGVVLDGSLLLGDNAAGGDVWCFRNSRLNGLIAEESVSIRAVQRVYAELSGESRSLTPRDIYDIAAGTAPGDAAAARESFASLGRGAGDILAQASTIVDGVIVLGGGLCGASEFFMPSLIEEMQSELGMMNGTRFCRMQSSALNLEDEDQLRSFVFASGNTIRIYGSDQMAVYDDCKQTPVVLSRLGASKAVSVGAYIFALNNIR